MKSKESILIVDDEQSVTGAMELILGDDGYDVSTAASVHTAMLALSNRPFALVFTDLRLPDGSGMDLLERIKSDALETEAILMTAHGSLDITIEAIKKGAFYYVEKPFTPDQVLMLASRALERVAMRHENRALKRALASEREAFGIIGGSIGVRRIYETIRATAPSDASVLIQGESGTGKELIATAFHLQSNRADHSFIRINCAAIPPDLIESELFGYKKGAFTGADRDKRGLIEAASGGTLLLDEIAEMPAHLQTKLLRVLQDRRLRRLGDDQEIEVDFRLISATNRDTARAIREGTLREDLYYRISTIKIKVPPLRERIDDLPLLAEHFLLRYGRKYNRPIRSVSQAALSLMARYQWPGNVRELESEIERAVLFCGQEEIGPEVLSEQVQAAKKLTGMFVIPPHLTLEEIEREAINQMLERTGGNVKKTAQMLDLHRPTLYRKLKKFGLKGNGIDEEPDDE
jgi:DNA-binding NtrC family response regulator